MAMVDRYKKTGGFLQLVQVIETCAPKKKEQFMSIISQESPQWATAINEKAITFEKIIEWKPEVILDIMASVNTLSFGASLKSLSVENLEIFLQKISHQERKKIEISMQETTSNQNEIGASILKVISETRALLIQGSLKAEKIDTSLIIPDEYESLLDKLEKNKNLESALVFEPVGISPSGSVSNNAEIEKLQKKINLLNREIQTLKQENQVMKDKLEKIKKIA